MNKGKAKLFIFPIEPYVEGIKWLKWMYKWIMESYWNIDNPYLESEQMDDEHEIHWTKLLNEQ